jgi:4-hydroxy-tetrahydrodipicolinate synthase
VAGRVNGVLIPLVTPFTDGRVDIETYKRLVRHYLGTGVHGLVPLGTTGESPAIEEKEYSQIVEATVDVVNGKLPVYVGVSSNSTVMAVHKVENLNRYNISGYLVTSPYFNLPSQEGIFEHYARVAGATDKQVLIYNIPHRTGRNVENTTTLRLSKIQNIVGIKDSSGNVPQSIELLRERDPGFSVLTGEVILFYFNVVSGGNGGIMASAHLQTERFVQVWDCVHKQDFRTALSEWNTITRMIPLLFKEPSPAPIKYVLARKGLIPSAELRLPMTGVSEAFKSVLDDFLT